jgi:hypothetical protein
VSLILAEGAALFAAVSATVFLWGSPLLLDWLDAATFVGQAAALFALLHRGLLLPRPLRPERRTELQPVRERGCSRALESPWYSSPASTRSSRTCGWGAAPSSRAC